jgi:hypothetical protein
MKSEQRTGLRLPVIHYAAREVLRDARLPPWLESSFHLYLYIDRVQVSMSFQSFWDRFNLGDRDGKSCMGTVRDAFAGYEVREFEEQGHCSRTFLMVPLGGTEHNNDGEKEPDEDFTGGRGTNEFIVQLRPAPHALDLDIMHVANKTYSSLAPTITALDVPLPAGLKAYKMNRLAGTPLSRLMPRACTLIIEEQARMETLVASFAKYIAQGWRCSSKAQTSPIYRVTRADSPMEDAPDVLSQCHGKVGSSISYRLKKLAAELPDACLREKAETILTAVQKMTDYPVALNHGDLIPSNVLVDERLWEVTGLVDWAEAEFLPFGTCLYGLEHMLGYIVPASSSTKPMWAYFQDAARLRNLFWERLFKGVPDIKVREDEVRMMRDMGVLLWHGIAWDDGAIDRVVSERRDWEELAKLRAFLSV